MSIFSALFGNLSPRPPAPKLPPSPSLRAPRGETIDGLRKSSVGIPYRLERTARKSIGLIIAKDGLLIRAPRWTPIYEIDVAIAERRDWIYSTLAKQQARMQQLAELSDGGHVLFRGKKLLIEFRAGLFESVDLTESECIVTTTDGQMSAALVNAALLAAAKREIPPLTKALALEAGLPLKSVGLSQARTTWGTCSVDGRVRLNYRLIQLPPALMRHVIAHELAHLVEFNHSKAFWSIVAALDPNSAAHKKAINQYAPLLEL